LWRLAARADFEAEDFSVEFLRPFRLIGDELDMVDALEHFISPSNIVARS
jgi:hypothetical protein